MYTHKDKKKMDVTYFAQILIWTDTGSKTWRANAPQQMYGYTFSKLIIMAYCFGTHGLLISATKNCN